MLFRANTAILLSSSLHQGLMAIHTKDPLRCAGVAQVLNLSLAIPTPKALSAECLLAGQDS
jgi:hypothetical protein